MPQAQSRKQRCWDLRLRASFLYPRPGKGHWDLGPLANSFLFSPEDLVSGFEAAEMSPVQLGLAATSNYGKKAGNHIPGPGNSTWGGPEAGLKENVFGGQQGDQCGCVRTEE